MAKIRANGEGNIRKRSVHSWEASIRTENGDRRYVYGKTKTEARDKLAEIQNDIYNDTLINETNITIEEWMNTWADCYIGKTKASTKARYCQDIRNHIIPELGKLNIHDINTKTVQRFLDRCQQVKGLSEKSLKNIYLVLNKAITRAQKDGLIRTNPCTDAYIPVYEEPKKEMRPLKDHEVPTFLKMIEGSSFENLYFIGLFTGMRESELIGLTWDCIDWQTNEIKLYRQYKAIRGESNQYTFTTLKNNQSRTFIAAHSVIKALKKEKAWQTECKLLHGQLYQNKDDFVFTDELGNHLATRTVYNRFKTIVEKMGLPQVRFHDLRHPDVKQATKNNGHYQAVLDW